MVTLNFHFRLSQVPVARNPSITSAQLNAAAPLVRVTRIPSTRFDTITEYQTVQQSSTFKTSSLRASIKSKARGIFSRPTTPRSPKSKKTNSISSAEAPEVQSGKVSSNFVSVKSEYSTTTSRSSTSSVVSAKQRPKSLFVEKSGKVSVNQRDSAVNPKFLTRSNAFLRPKESEESVNSSGSRNRYRGVSVPNPNVSSSRSTNVGEQLLGQLARTR